MQDFTKLQVWEKAHALSVSVYRATQRVKRSDFPGLVPQLRRSAASVPANIAEGCGHVGAKEFARFLQQAMASAFELEYHLILGEELGVLQRAACADLRLRVKEVKRMLGALIKCVRAVPE